MGKLTTTYTLNQTGAIATLLILSQKAPQLQRGDEWREVYIGF